MIGPKTNIMIDFASSLLFIYPYETVFEASGMF